MFTCSHWIKKLAVSDFPHPPGSRRVEFSHKYPTPLSPGSESSAHSSVSEAPVPQEGGSDEFASSTENPPGV